MDAFTDLTQGFLSMFETGGEILLGWMTTLLPMVVCLMTAVSAVVKLIGESRVERITKFLTRWRIARYMLLPLMAILFLGIRSASHLENFWMRSIRQHTMMPV